MRLKLISCTSWSPDGAFICASNARNNSAFVASIIERVDWKTEYSFVGHKNTIQVAVSAMTVDRSRGLLKLLMQAFNPILFFRPEDEHVAALASSVLALGADDHSISIWRNSLHKPMIVLHDIFQLALHDLCWYVTDQESTRKLTLCSCRSNDGLNLYGCSGDGTICAVSFDREEFPDLKNEEITLDVLKQQGYVDRSPWKGMKGIVQPSSTADNAVAMDTNAAGPEGGINQPMVKKSHPKAPRLKKSVDNEKEQRRQLLGTSALEQDFGFDAPIQPNGVTVNIAARMFEEAGSAFMNGDYGAGPSTIRGQKRRISLSGDGSPMNGKGRSLGTRGRLLEDVKEIRSMRRAEPVNGGGGMSAAGRRLPHPLLQTMLRAKVDDESYVEASNAENAERKNKVTFVEGDEVMWVDYQASGVVMAVGCERFVAIGREDGTVVAFGVGGRRSAVAMIMTENFS
jgi:protein HIRA/HIR1